MRSAEWAQTASDPRERSKDLIVVQSAEALEEAVVFATERRIAFDSLVLGRSADLECEHGTCPGDDRPQTSECKCFTNGRSAGFLPEGVLSPAYPVERSNTSTRAADRCIVGRVYPNHGVDATVSEREGPGNGFLDRITREAETEANAVVEEFLGRIPEDLRNRAERVARVMAALELPVPSVLSVLLPEAAPPEIEPAPRDVPGPPAPSADDRARVEREREQAREQERETFARVQQEREAVLAWATSHPGIRFKAPAVAADYDLSPPAIKQQLEYLVTQRLLRKIGTGPDAEYLYGEEKRVEGAEAEPQERQRRAPTHPGPEALPAELRNMPAAKKVIAVSRRIPIARTERKMLEYLRDHPNSIGVEISAALQEDEHRLGTYIRGLKEEGLVRQTGVTRKRRDQPTGKFGRAGYELVLTDLGGQALGAAPSPEPSYGYVAEPSDQKAVTPKVEPTAEPPEYERGLARSPSPRAEMRPIQRNAEEKLDQLVVWLSEHPGRTNASDIAEAWSLDSRPKGWFYRALKTLEERGVVRESGTMLSREVLRLRASSSQMASAGRASTAYELVDQSASPTVPKQAEEAAVPPTKAAPDSEPGRPPEDTGGGDGGEVARGPADRSNQQILNDIRSVIRRREGQFAAPDIAKEVGIGLATATKLLEALVSSGSLYGVNSGVSRRYRYERPTDEGEAARLEAKRSPGNGGGGGGGGAPVAGTGRGVRAGNKNVQAILDQCVRIVGQQNVSQSGGHWAIRCPNGQRVLIASTPSSERTLLNDKARLRRVGGLAIS